jgi:hypothetical protein
MLAPRILMCGVSFSTNLLTAMGDKSGCTIDIVPSLCSTVVEADALFSEISTSTTGAVDAESSAELTLSVAVPRDVIECRR